MTKECCQSVKNDKPAGFLPGLLYGLLPHTFCIAFVVFSVLGVTMATSIFKKLLMVPYFFQLLVVISFIFSTISAVIYLKRSGCLSTDGIKGKWKYLTILYGTTIGINLLFFMVIFPLTANMGNKSTIAYQNLSTVTLKVNIPCSGHAPLVTEELKKVSGVEGVIFRFPNLFDISFNKRQISLEQILDSEIFKSFPAKEISNG